MVFRTPSLPENIISRRRSCGANAIFRCQEAAAFPSRKTSRAMQETRALEPFDALRSEPFDARRSDGRPRRQHHRLVSAVEQMSSFTRRSSLPQQRTRTKSRPTTPEDEATCLTQHRSLPNILSGPKLTVPRSASKLPLVSTEAKMLLSFLYDPPPLQSPTSRPSSAGPQTSVVDAAAPASTSTHAHKLARLYRLPLHEVKRIAESFDSETARDIGYFSSLEGFQKWLCGVFGVEVVDQAVLKEAYEAAGMGGDGLDMNGFFSWYVQNMFRHVSPIMASSVQTAEERLVTNVASQHRKSAVDIDHIKKEFDRFDINKNGVISYNEFHAMLYSVLGLKEGDLTESRLKSFWAEFDKNGDQVIDFSEFTDWYLRYFKREDISKPITCELVDSLYENYDVDVIRRKSLVKKVKALLQPTQSVEPHLVPTCRNN